jgi:hypothetical protein
MRDEDTISEFENDSPRVNQRTNLHIAINNKKISNASFAPVQTPAFTEG